MKIKTKKKKLFIANKFRYLIQDFFFKQLNRPLNKKNILNHVIGTHGTDNKLQICLWVRTKCELEN